jgi:hypothetical protein
MVLNFSRWWYTNVRYRRSLKRAIKHAKHIKNHTGYKCYVLLFPGGYRAITKQAIKCLMRSKKRYFKKGTSIETIEKMAVYITW